jgi:hypothetical protein
MEHECKIYVLFDRRGKINYVGRTKRPLYQRMAEHKKLLGFRPTYRIIARCRTNCRNVERQWIAYYRKRGFKLRNIYYGQGPHFMSEASRMKLSLAFRGRPVTWGDKISAAQKGIKKNWSPLGRARVMATQFKQGENTWDRLTDDQKESLRQRAREQWKDPAKAARMMNLRLGSAWRTPDEQRQVTAKIKEWWRRLRADPERYREHIKRTRAAIIEALSKPGS